MRSETKASSPTDSSPFAPSYKIGFEPPSASPPLNTSPPPRSTRSTPPHVSGAGGAVGGDFSPHQAPTASHTSPPSAEARNTRRTSHEGRLAAARAEASNPFAPSYKLGAEDPGDAEPDLFIVDYHRLVWRDGGRQLPPGVNAAKLEGHLSDLQFAQVLGMARQQFYGMPIVEQMRLKQNVGLF